jgi:hypothetical protein
MHPQHDDPRNSYAIPTISIRSRAIWSGIAALLLCYFGFSGSWVVFSTSGWIYVYTLQLGGVAMAVCTLLLLSGWRTALAIDGIASMLIGGGLLASGLLMLIGGAMQGLLNLVFGYMFASSGWSSYSDWRWTTGGGRANTRGENQYDPGFESRYEKVMSQPPGDSLASQLLDRSRNPQPEPAISHPVDETPAQELGLDLAESAEPDDTANWDLAPEPTAADEPDQRPQPAPQDAPDGFLASFADPPPDKDRRP